jgi:hypothetical protein
MAGELDLSPKASDSERVSLHVVAALLPAKWTVVLREPSGGRGGSGGDTGDLEIFKGGSVAGVYQGGDTKDMLVEDVGSPFGIDVYTPEKSTSSEGVAKMVRSKLSSQTPRGVCVDLVNIPAVKRQTYITTASKEAKPKEQSIIFHVDGEDVFLYGKQF